MPRWRSSCRPTTEPAPRRDLGQVVLAVPVALVLAALAALGTARLGVVVIQRQRAQVAADAAALAGATQGEGAAAALAAANGAVLTDFQRFGDDVVVRVMVGEVDAEARASTGP